MDTKWLILSERMRKTGKFMLSRITPTALLRAVQTQRAVYKEQNGEVVAFAGLSETPEPLWLELGPNWVHEPLRGQGLASSLFPDRLSMIPQGRGIQVCSITSSEAAAHLARKHGFVEILPERWYLEVPWAVSCGPCDRTDVPNGSNYRLHCPLKGRLRPDLGVCIMLKKAF
jgi:GNAT superfamily N-acetyltransferase